MRVHRGFGWAIGAVAILLAHGIVLGAQGDDAAARREQIQQAAEIVRAGNSREKAMGLEVFGRGLYFTDFVADPKAFAPILDATKDRDPRVREAAVAALGNFYEHNRDIYHRRRQEKLPVPGETEVVAALKDPAPGVRVAAARIVAAHGWPEDLLGPLLQDQDPRVRAVAAGGSSFSSGATADALIALLDDDRDWRFRFAKAAALRRVGGHTDPPIPHAILKLAVTDPALRALALATLWSFEVAKVPTAAVLEAHVYLVEKLPDGRERRTALGLASLHGEIKDPGRANTTIEKVITRLTPVGVEHVATLRPGDELPPLPGRPTALPPWWKAEHLPIFLGFLQDPNPEVRRAAVPFVGLAASGAAAVAALRKALDDPDPSVRVRMIEVLGPLAADPTLAARLEQAAADPAPEVRRAATKVLVTSTRDPTALWQASLQDPDPKVREQALRELGKATTAENAAQLIPFLAAHLGGPDREVARQTLAAIGERLAVRKVQPARTGIVGGPAYTTEADPWRQGPQVRAENPALLAGLLPALRDPRPEARLDALQILERLYAPTLADAVSPLLGDPDPRVRKAALNVLRIARVPSLLPAIIRFTKDADAEVRVAAVRSLDAYREETQARLALVEAYRDQTPKVRSSVVVILSRIFQEPEVRQILLLAARDADGEIRRIALRTLEDHKDPELVDILIEQTRDPKTAVTAADALGRTKVDRAVPHLIPLLAPGNDPAVRVFAADALAKIGNPVAVEPLIASLRQLEQSTAWQEQTARRIFLKALSEFHDPRGVPLYFDLSRHPDIGTRLSAITALAEVGSPEARDRLMAMAKGDAMSGVRAHAAEKLEKLGNGPVTSLLLAALQDPDPVVRDAAVKALGRRKNREAFDALLDALQAGPRSKSYIQNAALEALLGMLQPGDVERIQRRLANETHPNVKWYLEHLLRAASAMAPR